MAKKLKINSDSIKYLELRDANGTLYDENSIHYYIVYCYNPHHIFNLKINLNKNMINVAPLCGSLRMMAQAEAYHREALKRQRERSTVLQENLLTSTTCTSDDEDDYRPIIKRQRRQPSLIQENLLTSTTSND